MCVVCGPCEHLQCEKLVQAIRERGECHTSPQEAATAGVQDQKGTSCSENSCDSQESEVANIVVLMLCLPTFWIGGGYFINYFKDD